MEWTIENLEYIANQYRQAIEIQKRFNKMADWLELDPKANFGELVEFLSKERVEVAVNV